jgi:hypothetical protein
MTPFTAAGYAHALLLSSGGRLALKFVSELQGLFFGQSKRGASKKTTGFRHHLEHHKVILTTDFDTLAPLCSADLDGHGRSACTSAHPSQRLRRL